MYLLPQRLLLPQREQPAVLTWLAQQSGGSLGCFTDYAQDQRGADAVHLPGPTLAICLPHSGLSRHPGRGTGLR